VAGTLQFPARAIEAPDCRLNWENLQLLLADGTVGGPAGPAGPAGATGAQGSAGNNGTDGLDGAAGALDGGAPDTVYGGLTALDGGTI
jgi:hypothetical protein